MSTTEYPKINGVYKRDERGRFIFGSYAQPEFELLAEVPWLWTEKVDGTNIRLHYHVGGTSHLDAPWSHVAGRTDKAQIPPKLLDVLVRLMRDLPLAETFDKHADEGTVVTLYGEGYGAGIQKGGGLYRPDPSFVLFDVKVGPHWLSRANVEDVATKLAVDVVPVVWEYRTLHGALAAFENAQRIGDPPFESQWPGAIPEGVVGRPAVDVFDRKGQRITTKLKVKDFR